MGATRGGSDSDGCCVDVKSDESSGSEQRTMHIELNHDEAEAVRDLLQQRVVELDKEINRTDSRAFKKELQRLDRTIERALGEISAALEQSDRTALPRQ